jgi:hypothetical protein
MDKWLDEKDTLRRLCGELMVDTLWNKEIVERHTETEYHDLRIIKQGNVVTAFLKKK